MDNRIRRIGEVCRVQSGFIAGITDQGFFTKHKYVKTNLQKGGFLSRTTVCSINYSASQVDKILDEIFNGKHLKKRVKHIPPDFPNKKKKVYLPKEHKARAMS